MNPYWREGAFSSEPYRRPVDPREARAWPARFRSVAVNQAITIMDALEAWHGARTSAETREKAQAFLDLAEPLAAADVVTSYQSLGIDSMTEAEWARLLAGAAVAAQ